MEQNPFEELRVAELVKNSSPLVGSDDASPCPQEPTTSPYPEPAESSPYLSTPPL